MYLSKETEFRVRRRGPFLSWRSSLRWETQTSGVISRLGLLLVGRTEVVSPRVLIREDSQLLITAGAYQRGNMVGYRVLWRRDGLRKDQCIVTWNVLESSAEEPWQERTFDVRNLLGQTGSFVIEPTAETTATNCAELIIYEIVLASRCELDLERARSFRKLRIENEKRNFDAYYQHEVFQNSKPTDAGNADAAATNVPGTPSLPPKLLSAFEYSRRRLAERIKLNPPPFGYLLHQYVKDSDFAPMKRGGRRLRVLSVCSGAARIETSMLRGLSPELIEITLLDINENLLRLGKQACQHHLLR